MRILLLTAALLLLIPTPGTAEAKCDRTWIGAYLATPSDVALPTDARLIVLERSTREGTRPEDVKAAGDAALRSYSLKSEAGDTIALEPLRLGPSVIALSPAETPADGVWTVTGLAKEATVTYSSEATRPEPPIAPEVSVVTATLGEPRGRGWRSKNIGATLSAPVPEGVIVALAEWDRRMTKMKFKSNGAAHPVEAGAESISIFAWPGRCGTSHDDFSFPNDGKEVVVSYIDVTGQLSKPSAKVEAKRVEE